MASPLIAIGSSFISALNSLLMFAFVHFLTIIILQGNSEKFRSSVDDLNVEVNASIRLSVYGKDQSLEVR